MSNFPWDVTLPSKDQNQDWWDLYGLASTVEDWIMAQQGSELQDKGA